ncbi:MAG: STAS domain-containing protein [Planctomycetota bacterium]|jgi:anti-anti-sigma factor
MKWEDRDGERWIHLEGELDHIGTEGLVERLMETADDGNGAVVLDFALVTFVGSPGLRVLLQTHHQLKSNGRKLRVCGLRPGVRRVFATTGIFEAIPEIEA